MTVSTWVFFQLLQAGNYTCTYCGCWGTATDFEVDHALPKAWGGTDAPENLRLACRGCNAQKGIKTEIEYRAWRWANPSQANVGPY